MDGKLGTYPYSWIYALPASMTPFWDFAPQLKVIRNQDAA